MLNNVEKPTKSPFDYLLFYPSSEFSLRFIISRDLDRIKVQGSQLKSASKLSLKLGLSVCVWLTNKRGEIHERAHKQLDHVARLEQQQQH